MAQSREPYVVLVYHSTDPKTNERLFTMTKHSKIDTAMNEINEMGGILCQRMEMRAEAIKEAPAEAAE